MGGLGDLLRPPPHRGPLIAAGTVALAVGIALVEVRLADRLGAGIRAGILLVPGALWFWLGAQAPNEDGRPPAYQSVLLITGVAALWFGLGTVAGGLGMDAPTALILPSLITAGAALWAALRRASAVCLLLAVVLGGVALAATWMWLLDGHVWVLRWLLLAMAATLVLASLGLHASAPRHAQQLVNGAGLMTLALAATGVRLDEETIVLGGFWQAVLLAAGLGLLAFAAVERAPGPAWLGVLNLLAFVSAASHADTLYWWPLVLLAAGGAMLAAGLRPRRPLPPEPPAYKAGDAPLAARAEEDEMVFRVRDD
jgi:MFS family permease